LSLQAIGRSQKNILWHASKETVGPSEKRLHVCQNIWRCTPQTS